MTRDPRLDPQLGALLDLLDGSGYPPMEEGTPEDGRAGFRAMTVGLVQPGAVVPVGSVEESEIAGRPVRVYRPEDDGPTATVLFIHGGGFVVGDLDTHDQCCRRLCRDTGAVVVSVDYRLAPEHPFPAAVDDSLAVARVVAERLGELGGTGRYGVAGDSAGGNLAAVVAQELRDVVTAQLLVYPATHVLGDYPSRTENAEGYFLTRPMMEWFMTHYALGVDGVDLEDARLSPLGGQLAGLPPAVVATAWFDPLRDEGEAYAAALAEAGVAVDQVRYDGLIHGFLDMGLASQAAAAAVEDLHARFAAIL
jgi:acetyl esterase